MFVPSNVVSILEVIGPMGPPVIVHSNQKASLPLTGSLPTTANSIVSLPLEVVYSYTELDPTVGFRIPFGIEGPRIIPCWAKVDTLAAAKPQIMSEVSVKSFMTSPVVKLVKRFVRAVRMPIGCDCIAESTTRVRLKFFRARKQFLRH